MLMFGVILVSYVRYMSGVLLESGVRQLSGVAPGVTTNGGKVETDRSQGFLTRDTW